MIFNKVISRHSVFSNQISHIGSNMYMHISVLSKIGDVGFSTAHTGVISLKAGPRGIDGKIGNRGSSLSFIGDDKLVNLKRTDSKSRVSCIGV